RTDDHDLLLADMCGQGRNEENWNEATTPSGHEAYEVPSGHIATCSPCLIHCGVRIFRLLRRPRADRMAEPVPAHAVIYRSPVERGVHARPTGRHDRNTVSW